ncbi:MAG: hypothetical protein UZ09_BCD002001223 [Bacteroidetes bacterium OLB9]|nr:MAG: hypothetical protein UZ09_BCD002001223 [Bacteroidetes bacterium OLB9]
MVQIRIIVSKLSLKSQFEYYNKRNYKFGLRADTNGNAPCIKIPFQPPTFLPVHLVVGQVL